MTKRIWQTARFLTNRALSISLFSWHYACHFLLSTAINSWPQLCFAQRFRKPSSLGVKLTVGKGDTLWLVCLGALSHGFFQVSHELWQFNVLCGTMRVWPGQSLVAQAVCSTYILKGPMGLYWKLHHLIKGHDPLKKITLLLVILPLLRSKLCTALVWSRLVSF